MINLRKIVLLSTLMLLSSLSANEPSVYGAGNIESATPYGLTQTEQTVLENKKTIQMLYNKMTEQQRKVDGLSTIIEGQNKEILQLKEELRSQLKNSQQRQQQQRQQQQQDSNRSYTLLLELGEMIDTIKNSYVTKDALHEALVVNNNSRVSSSVGTTTTNSYTPNSGMVASSTYENSTPESTTVDINYAESYREGVQLFYNRSYQAAKEHFEEVLAANYKSAASNFYLGEIAYYTHQYANAVTYYKQSAALYDSASYMDVLYLHTAISLEKTGDSEQANGFYEYIIATYPGKKSASIARNRLSK